MRIPLDRQSEIPLYQQIGTYLRNAILSGNLAVDTRLPAYRQLAQDLGVNRTTIENAYSVLEAEGLVFSRMGSGTYVLPQNLTLPKPNTDITLPLWQQRFHSKNIVSKSDVVDEMLQAAGHPQAISFASGISDTQYSVSRPRSLNTFGPKPRLKVSTFTPNALAKRKCPSS